jgi:hypothetical protein
MSDSSAECLTLINEAAFSNPFDPARLEKYCELAGEKKPTQNVDSDKLARRIESEGLDLKNWKKEAKGKKRQMLRTAALFYLYQSHNHDLRDLVLKQDASPEAVVTHPVTDRLYRDLLEYGFSQEQAGGFVGMAFQFRRAYHFTTHALKGSGQIMQQLRMHLWRSIFTDDIDLYESHMWNRMQEFSTLLLGPTGSGKGVAASIIGRSSYIPYNPQKSQFTRNFASGFIELNLSQFPASLIESELFGHRKGAFTGAINDYDGHIRRCPSNGVLFLDEIGELQPDLQIKLLHLLQDRKFSPVGSHESHRFQGRIVSATNQPLDDLRERGVFRDDFYYRIATDVIRLPTLQQRLAESPAELNELAAHFLEQVLGRKDSRLEEETLTALSKQIPKEYPWPGNVRELEQAIRSLLLTGHFETSVYRPESMGWNEGARAGKLTAAELLSGYCHMLYQQLGSYEAVARRTDLDRRTVKKYVDASG